MLLITMSMHDLRWIFFLMFIVTRGLMAKIGNVAAVVSYFQYDYNGGASLICSRAIPHSRYCSLFIGPFLVVCKQTFLVTIFLKKMTILLLPTPPDPCEIHTFILGLLKITFSFTPLVSASFAQNNGDWPILIDHLQRHKQQLTPWTRQ